MFKLVPRNRLKKLILKRNLSDEFKEDGERRSSCSARRIPYETQFRGGILFHKRRIAGWVIGWELRKEIHVYVFPEFRGKGLFCEVIKIHQEYFSDYVFCPWNNFTIELFARHKLPTTVKYVPFDKLNKYRRAI